MLSKPKFFVRYPGGGCGHFLSLLILALKNNNLTLVDNFSGHSQSLEINVGHNFNQQWDLGIDPRLTKGSDVNEATAWLLDNFSFSHTLRKFYVVHTHIEMYEPVLQAWPESKVVNISCSKLDMPQLAFNFVTKAHNSLSEEIIADRIRIIQARYNMLEFIDSNKKSHIEIVKRNVKLYTYVILHSWPDLSEIYPFHETTERAISIPFRDIYQGNSSSFLSRLIEFLNLNVSTKNYHKATSMIQQYAAAQRNIPWNLPVEFDFESVIKSTTFQK